VFAVNRSLAIKLGTIALLVLLLIIPIEMISGVVRERQLRRDAVVEDIARSSAYRQELVGPLLVVPYSRTMRVWKQNADTKERYQEEYEISGQLQFLPDALDVNGDLQIETRNRGIYETRLYHSTNHISGHFAVAGNWGITENVEDYHFGDAYLAIGISDIRGIENAMTLTMNGRFSKFEPGTKLEFLGSGVHALLPVEMPQQPTRLQYALDLKLQGTGMFHLTPVGRESTVTLTSPWPHPAFIGAFLPATRSISEAGFSATWQTSFFSTDLEQKLKSCVDMDRVRKEGIEQAVSCKDFRQTQFGVSLIDPVDQYLKSDRAIKYALLFVALTFAGFFLFEILKRLAVHPVQYALVGMALAFFYLLLLSLSEHIGFFIAYLISSTACVLLIGMYVASVLRSAGRGIGFGAGLAALYGLLYGLLSAEDYALLMGSLLLFGLLGVVMMLTRKIDWFGIGKPTDSADNA